MPHRLAIIANDPGIATYPGARLFRLQNWNEVFALRMPVRFANAFGTSRQIVFFTLAAEFIAAFYRSRASRRRRAPPLT
jgi:hypothetical protein